MVSGASTGRLKVTWGKTSKIFSADELGRGINLAAELLDNPFSEPFRVVMSAVRRKQELETQGMRGAGQSAVRWLGPDQRSGVEKLPVGVLEKARALEPEVRAAVKPVIHTLKIERVP